MNVLKTIVPALLLSLMLCSCASSKRMFRLSGDGDYRPPEQRFMASAKWAASGRAVERLDMAGEHINLWPMFYRNNNYWSALWPMFDYDRYGMAVRPFFNLEGDEYAILFPLIAWNPANRDGWGAFIYWRPETFGMAPLMHIGPETVYAFPVYYRNFGDSRLLVSPLGGAAWNDRWSSGIVGPYIWRTGPDAGRGILPLWYGDVDSLYLFPVYYRNFGSSRLLITPLGGMNWSEQWSYGVIGPYFWGTGDDAYRGIFPLWYSDSGTRYLFPTLFFYDGEGKFESGGVPLLAWHKPGRHTYSFPLFYYGSDWQGSVLVTPLGGGAWDDSETTLVFANTYWTEDSFGAVPIFHWGERFKYAGPFWMNSNNNWGLFPLVWSIDDVFLTLPLYGHTDTGFWTPLFGLGRDRNGDVDLVNVLGPLFIKSWEGGGGASTLVGLFNYFYNAPERRRSRSESRDGLYYLADDLLYLKDRATPELRRRIARLIDVEADPETLLATEDEWRYRPAPNMEFTSWPLLHWERDGEQTEFQFLAPLGSETPLALAQYHDEDDQSWWNVLGLAGGLRETDRPWRADVPELEIELERTLAQWMYQERQAINRQTWAEDPAAAQALGKQQAEALRTRTLELLSELGRAGEMPADAGEAAAMARRLAAANREQIETRRLDYLLPLWWDDNDTAGRAWLALGGVLGCGFSDRTSSSFNILGFLARGKSENERREFRILEYLYYSEHDGDKHRYTVFPFITWQSEGETKSRFSFLWKLLEFSEEDGRRSGSIFFIPYGD